MNDELIEKVARACCIANDCDPDTIHEGSPIWVNWIDDAKAAIAAMQPHIAAERENAAQAERAAVVEWLRKRHDGGLTSRIYLADAIEAGEHRA